MKLVITNSRGFVREDNVSSNFSIANSIKGGFLIYSPFDGGEIAIALTEDTVVEVKNDTPPNAR